MNELGAIGVVVLAAVVHATLQLGLGCLLLLYHASLGKHIKKKTRSLVGSYIAGVGIIAFLSLSAGCFVIGDLFDGGLSTDVLALIVGILLALALIVCLFYYRRGKSTELWLPKGVARFIDRRAKATESDTEAFSLGVLTCFAELPFTLVLVVIAADSVLQLPALYQALAVAFYTVVTIAPLVIMRLAIHSGKTVVDIQRWRVKHKNFLKVITGLGFLALGLFIFAFEVLVA